MYKLYDYNRSSASYRLRIALNYKRLDYTKHEVHLVNNGGEQHSEAYKLINHQELVPALCIDLGSDSDSNKNKNTNILTQSMAILEYLQEKHPNPSILPDAHITRAQARSLANIISCDIHPLNNLRVLNYLKSEYKISEQEKLKWYHNWLKLGFDSYEYYIKQYNKSKEYSGDFSIGNSLTIADICLIPQVYNALRFNLLMADYPNILNIYNKCLELSYVDDAQPR